jgi:CHAP domain
MSDWWKTPYPTNPNPPAVQQPRQVFPPDIANGYEPSDDGADVVAYKRAVSRLGRWEWANFDSDYSNRFAHGEPGEHVPTTGIAGIQRQSGLDDTGNLGAKTFQVLRCALIPEGLPNAGEPAMDAEAVALLNGTKWWKYPYALGPGPKGSGGIAFPRPLYAPDWQAQPSPADGPDVEAYKRAVSRLGRWPWQTFNEVYTNDFAHGTSGNVGETGIAGYQRQEPELDDTGNVSERLFNLLMRSLVPPCLPHANEYGMDGRALDLLKEANKHTPGNSTRERALNAAIGQVGYVESPNGSNNNKYGAWYGMNGVPWCAIFCTWCFEEGAGGADAFAKGSYYSYVPYVVSDARNGRRGLSVTSTPKPGDLVCYDWGYDGTFDHIGIFKSGSSYEFHAIEGNTSTGNQSNGGQVMDRVRFAGDASMVFVRVAE